MQSAMIRVMSPKRIPSLNQVSKFSDKTFTEKAKEVAQTVKEKIVGATDTAQSKAQEVGQKAKETGQSAKEKLTEMSKDAVESLRQSTGQTAKPEAPRFESGKTAKQFGREIQSNLDKVDKKSVERMKSME